MEDQVDDPNAMKFIPDVIHFDRTQFSTTQSLLDMISYQMFLKEEEKFMLMIDDSTFESRQGDIIDLCFAGGISYLNLRGIGKPEKAAKVDRLQEVVEMLKQHDIARESIGSPNISIGSVPISMQPDKM